MIKLSNWLVAKARVFMDIVGFIIIVISILYGSVSLIITMLGGDIKWPR